MLHHPSEVVPLRPRVKPSPDWVDDRDVALENFETAPYRYRHIPNSKANFSQVAAAKILLPEAGLLKLVPIKGKGRGVVTTKPLKRNKMIEAGPVIRMKKRDRLDRSTVLSHYPFGWDEPPYVQAFPLGYAGLLNHSDQPNCKIETDIAGQVLCITTLRAIEAGEELTWSYGIDPWFDVA